MTDAGRESGPNEGAADAGATRDWLEHPRAMMSSIYDYLGMAVTDGGEGWVEVTLRISDVLLNADGVLHGGMWSLVADSAMGGAVRTMIPQSERTITTQADFRWMRPLSGDVLRAVGRVQKAGRTGWHTTAEVFDAEGTLVGLGSSTFIVVTRE